MRALTYAVLLVLIGIAAATGVTVGSHSQSVDVRVAARSTDNDQIEFAIQQRLPDGSWSDYKFGSARFFGPSLHDGRWKHATAVELELPIPHPPTPTATPLPQTDTSGLQPEGTYEERGRPRLSAIARLFNRRSCDEWASISGGAPADSVFSSRVAKNSGACELDNQSVQLWVWGITGTRGLEITSYDIRYRPYDGGRANTGAWTVISPASAESVGLTYSGGEHRQTHASTVTGLTEGVMYDFQVRAVSSAGAGPWSGTSLSRPGPIPPPLPSYCDDSRGERRVKWPDPDELRLSDNRVEFLRSSLRTLWTWHIENYRHPIPSRSQMEWTLTVALLGNLAFWVDHQGQWEYATVDWQTGSITNSLRSGHATIEQGWGKFNTVQIQGAVVKTWSEEDGKDLHHVALKIKVNGTSIVEDVLEDLKFQPVRQSAYFRGTASVGLLRVGESPSLSFCERIDLRRISDFR